jgi:phage terminase large subunit
LSILKRKIPAVFEPLLAPARYKGAFGGRGSGKSHFFGEQLIEDKIRAFGVESRFRIFKDRIETPGDGLIIFQGMQDHTAESIKSLHGFKRAWIEEAQNLSPRSLALLRPTIRTHGSEIWASWNAQRKSDAIDEFLRGKKPEDATVVKANWRDNPFFPAVLEEERRLDLMLHADRYEPSSKPAPPSVSPPPRAPQKARPGLQAVAGFFV